MPTYTLHYLRRNPRDDSGRSAVPPSTLASSISHAQHNSDKKTNPRHPQEMRTALESYRGIEAEHNRLLTRLEEVQFRAPDPGAAEREATLQRALDAAQGSHQQLARQLESA